MFSKARAAISVVTSSLTRKNKTIFNVSAFEAHSRTSKVQKRISITCVVPVLNSTRRCCRNTMEKLTASQIIGKSSSAWISAFNHHGKHRRFYSSQFVIKATDKISWIKVGKALFWLLVLSIIVFLAPFLNYLKWTVIRVIQSFYYLQIEYIAIQDFREENVLPSANELKTIIIESVFVLSGAFKMLFVKAFVDDEVYTYDWDSLEEPPMIIWDTSAIPIKDQKWLRACTVVAAVGLVECHYWLFKGKKLELSAQEILDYGASFYLSAKRGLREAPFVYMKRHGIGYEKDYPYVGGRHLNAFGKIPPFERSEVEITEIIEFPPCTEHELAELLAEFGPLLVEIKTTAGFLAHQTDEIFDQETDETSSLHAAVLVGCGSENGVDYWLIRNSYGPKWGDGGFIRIARGKRTCGIGKGLTHCIKIA